MLRVTTGLAIIAALLTTAASAQDYPNRNVTMVVPYAAGGGLDVLARTLAKPLGERLGKTVIVENRPGAGTVVGASYVAKAPPDGYTIMLGTSSPLAINVTLHKKLPYDPAKEFVPVAMISSAPFLLLVHPSLPAKTVPELVALVKQQPGKFSYGSGGPGSPQHLSMELLKSMTGMDIVHVPYRGDAPALTDLLANHIQLQFAEATPAVPLVRDGKVRALGVSAATRIPPAPDIPPLGEAGVPGFALTSWQMMVAPAGTPRPILERLHAEFKWVLNAPEVKAEYARTGRISMDYPSLDELAAFMTSEVGRMGRIVEQAGLAGSE